MRIRSGMTACAGLLCIASINVSNVRAQVEIAALRTQGDAALREVHDSSRARAGPERAANRFRLVLHNVALKDALRAIARKGEVVLLYNDRDIPAARRVSIADTDITVAGAIRLVLSGLDLTAHATAAGIVIEARGRSSTPSTPADTTGSIIGSVTDSTTGEAIAGATIVVGGASRSAVTGSDGRYRITGLRAGSTTLVVRRLGYLKASRQVSVEAGQEAVANLRIVPTPRMLDQIVTTATGDQMRRELGNLIATINADSAMATAPVTNLSQLLAGRVAGVQVYFGGGLTGVSSPINIRGQNSLSLSNQPLLVVDGVRVDNSTVGPPTAPTGAGLSSGRFDDLDPTEIESVEIVKGPSAATLYGTDAANGVILVKTKRGTIGPPSWRVFAEGGILTFNRDRFATNYFPWGHALSGTSGPIRCQLLAVAAATCVQDSVTSFSPLRDPETTPIGSGSRHEIGVQVQGGSSVRYLLSATRQTEVGYLKMPSADRALLEAQAGRALTMRELHPNGLDKYSVRTNVTVPLSAAATIGISAALIHATLRIPNPTALLFGGASPGVRDENDGWALGYRAGDYFIKRDRQHVTHFTGGATANWHPNDWMTGHLTAGLDLSSDYVDRLSPAGLGFAAATLRGSRDNTKIDVALQTVDAGLSLTLPLDSVLTSRTSIGAQYNHRTALTNTAAAQTLVPGAQTVAGGAVPIVKESSVESVVAGAYVEETIGWRERLYLTGAARVDGASSFGAGFRVAVYPKASLSWLLSDESFWPRIPGVTSLRLRAAYGESGVQPGPVASLQAETLFPAAIGSGTTTGARLGEIGNSELRPERQTEFEGGLDLELLSGRFGVQATYYEKQSRDALVSVALPASFGGGTQWQNVGAVRNRGFEALVNARLLTTSRLSWDVAIGGSVNHNTLLAISPAVDAIYRSGTTLPSLVRGYPMKSYFDYPIESYSDANGDGIIAPDEVTVGDAPEYAGPGYPRLQLNGTTNVGLFNERLTLSAVVEHRGGYVIAKGAEDLRCLFAACVGTSFRNTAFAAQAANVARVTAALHNTYWGYYEDGSFTRLRELSLTYSIPHAFLTSLRVNSASVTLSGRNLALWSAYSGTDPEVQSSPGNSDVAATYDAAAPPAPTYWLLRINVGF